MLRTLTGNVNHNLPFPLNPAQCHLWRTSGGGILGLAQWEGDCNQRLLHGGQECQHPAMCGRVPHKEELSHPQCQVKRHCSRLGGIKGSSSLPLPSVPPDLEVQWFKVPRRRQQESHHARGSHQVHLMAKLCSFRKSG